MLDKKTHISAPVWITIGVIVGIIVKLFFIDFLTVSGTSMEPTIHDGSIICVNKAAFGFALPGKSSLFVQWAFPKQEDIVIYLYDNKIVVKRCIATAGTELTYTNTNGYSMTVAHQTIPLTEVQYKMMHTCTKVPEGYLLAVGDNYAYSIDSRTYGFVAVGDILGKVVCK
ncbi:MAG: signal peptidase I [Treponema sp.]|nr:signal peptidase I [Treponema sp.]